MHACINRDVNKMHRNKHEVSHLKIQVHAVYSYSGIQL